VILAFTIGWVVFRSETLTQAVGYLQMMFGFADAPLIDPVGWIYFKETFYYWLPAVIFAMPVADYVYRRYSGSKILTCCYPVAYTVLLLLCICYMVKGTYNPFIYFNF
jgi:alginate O-acetyltransferase complex protein AlgI